ncbi:peroxiredoxin [Moraxella sp. Pampa]|uniref:peroxiredoxin n=1 Tax=Moraxella sp. Pampa TaxID=3111978 RepID=UPI002B4129E9|nr:peroxiredoxin [Moraxella sp. Pampa]
MMTNTHENITLPTFEITLVEHNTTRQVDLANFVKSSGQGLILYFYPKDNTAGCSVQAVDFTVLKDEFTNKGYQIIGVSRDGIKSHHNFISKKALNIALASDTDEMLCQHFDVIKEKMMYGKTHLGVIRSTFVFDKNGQMTASYRNIKAKEHAKTLLNTL